MYLSLVNMIVLFISTALIAVVCLSLTIYNIYVVFQSIKPHDSENNVQQTNSSER